MRGETIIVRRRIQSGVDAGNNPVYKPDDKTVDNVLVQPSSGSNATETTRPDGITVDATLHFPRDYTGESLRGCTIIIRGDEQHPYHVIGDPIPVDGGMTPTQWNMSVEVTRSEG